MAKIKGETLGKYSVGKTSNLEHSGKRLGLIYTL